MTIMTARLPLLGGARCTCAGSAVPSRDASTERCPRLHAGESEVRALLPRGSSKEDLPALHPRLPTATGLGQGPSYRLPRNPRTISVPRARQPSSQTGCHTVPTKTAPVGGRWPRAGRFRSSSVPGPGMAQTALRALPWTIPSPRFGAKFTSDDHSCVLDELCPWGELGRRKKVMEGRHLHSALAISQEGKG